MVALNHPAQGNTNWFAPVDSNWSTIESTLNALYGFCNYLINPGFEVWNTGSTSYSSPTDGQTLVRGWFCNLTNAPTFTILQDGITVKSGAYSIQVNVTAGVVGGIVKISQKISANPREFQGQAVTFTCQLKTSSASKAKIQIIDSAGNTDSSFHSGSGNWENLSVTRTVDSAATSLQFSIYVDASAAVTVNADQAVVALGSGAGTYAPPSPLQMMISNLILVETKKISSDTSSITFSGLDGDQDGLYYIVGQVHNGAGLGLYLLLEPNGITANQVSVQEQITSSATSVGAISNLSISTYYTNAAGADYFVYAVFMARSGLSRFVQSAQCRQAASGSATMDVLLQFGLWSDTSTKVTSIVLADSTGVNAIGAGSIISLYKVPRL
jgi:hypothetical protein